LALGHADRIEPDPVAGRDRMHRRHGASSQGALGRREAVRAAMSSQWRRLKPSQAPDRIAATAGSGRATGGILRGSVGSALKPSPSQYGATRFGKLPRLPAVIALNPS